MCTCWCALNAITLCCMNTMYGYVLANQLFTEHTNDSELASLKKRIVGRLKPSHCRFEFLISNKVREVDSCFVMHKYVHGGRVKISIVCTHSPFPCDHHLHHHHRRRRRRRWRHPLKPMSHIPVWLTCLFGECSWTSFVTGDSGQSNDMQEGCFWNKHARKVQHQTVAITYMSAPLNRIILSFRRIIIFHFSISHSLFAFFVFHFSFFIC